MRSPTYEPPIDPSRSELMRRVRQRGTKAENEVSGILRELGFGYRRNVRTLPGSPDFANKSERWAIFVNGCFWHRHRNCHRATLPQRNRGFWISKFDANCARDRAKSRALRRLGFRVVVVWECELERKSQLRGRLRSLIGNK